MGWIRSKTFAVIVGAVGVAAILGGSLGIATASVRHQPLTVGFNLVGGPLSADVAPGDFVGCLPATSWSAVYLWDGAHQQWQHFFNTQGTTAVPAYVNATASGGIAIIPRLSGVALIMNSAVSSPQLRDAPNEACGS
jgi:hypothetical protein